MDSDKVMLRDIFSILLKYKKSIALIFVVTLGSSIQLTSFLKKQYKSEFEINVYSKYFKNPLISGIIPGVYNIPEMRFTINSMVKEAINDDFIDQIATDYQIYSLETDEVTLAKNRQLLRDRFSEFSTGGQSYKVTFTAADPYVAKSIAEKTLDRVKAQFIDSRIKTIEMVKHIMLRRLKAFNASQKMTTKGSEKALASKSPEVLSAELKKIEANIAALGKQYNTTHPKIRELVAKKKVILNWLEEYKASSIEELDAAAITMPADKTVNGQLTSKFYTKYHDFNMALDIEKRSLESYIGVIKTPQLPTTPIWPKKRLFAIVGFVLGLIFAFLYVFIKEIMIPSKQELLSIEAKSLGIEFLGVYHLSSSIDKELTVSHNLEDSNSKNGRL